MFRGYFPPVIPRLGMRNNTNILEDMMHQRLIQTDSVSKITVFFHGDMFVI